MTAPDPGPRYELLETLGVGAFGAVYRGLDRTLGRPVALKRSLPQADEADPGLQAQRFLAEAGVLQGIRHPGVCQVLDAFTRRDEAWLVLDLVEGEALQERLKQCGALKEGELLEVMRSSLEALVHLHSLTPPVVHRDLKPANLRLTPDGRVVLVDFGLARPRQRGQRDTERLGTPGYAAPEQCAGLSEPASDLYAWAGTIFHAASGVAPVQDARPFPPLGQFRPDLPTWIEGLLEACIRPRPEDRPTAAQALECVRLGVPPERTASAPGPDTPNTPGAGSATTRLGSCPHCGVQETPVYGCCPSCQLGPELAGQGAASLVTRAEQLLRSQRPEATLAHLSRAGGLHSKDPRIPLLRARGLLDLGDAPGALSALSSCAPTPEVRLERARALLREGRAAEGLHELHGVPGAEAELLRVFAGPPGARLLALQAAGARFPGAPAFVRARAGLLAGQGHGTEALELLEEALATFPEDLGLLRQRVRLLQDLGRHAESLVHLRTWRRLVDDDPEWRWRMGRAHAAAGRPLEARRAFLEHLELRPGAHEVRLELARLLLNQSGRPEEALPLLEELGRLPDWKDRVQEFHGLALARCGRFQEAELKLRPLVAPSSDADLVARYAQVLRALGHADLARQWARRAQQLDPGCALAAELVQG